MRFNPRIITVAIGGLAAGALLVPGIVGANARRTTGNQQGAAALERTFTAVLKGSEEIGGGDTDGTGAATITVDEASGQVCVDSIVANLGAVSLTHIHKGAVGVNGPVVVDFAITAGTTALSKCVIPTDATIPGQIIANPAGFYYNVHTSDGFPGGAVRGNFAVHADGAGAIHLLPSPLRAFDSRSGVTAPAKIAAGATQTVNLWFGKDGAGATQLAVPPGAKGALVTLTVTETLNAGYLKLYAGDLTAAPATSTINWSATNEDVANNVTVAVSAGQDVKVTAGPQPTHFVIDVVGYLF